MKSKILKLIFLIIMAPLSIYNLSAKSAINKDHNVIHLIGENHDYQECIEYKQFLEEEATNGNIILANEGSGYESTLALEEEEIMTFFVTFLFYTQLSFYKVANDISLFDYEEIYSNSRLRRKIRQCFTEIFGDPNVINQLCGLVIGLKHTENEEILVKCNEFFQESSYESRWAELTENHSFEAPCFLNLHQDISQWIQAFKNMFESSAGKIEISNPENEALLSAKKRASMYIKEFQEYFEKDIEKMSITERSNMLTASLEAREFILSQSAPLRDPIFLKNTIRIFEDNKSKEKPLYVIVGYKHVPFLYKELTKRGYQVELNEMGREFLVSSELSEEQKPDLSFF